MAHSSHENQDRNVAAPTRLQKIRTLEPYVYLVYVGICTLVAANSFFLARALHLQWAEAARTALDPTTAARHLAPVWWSAPLDDTFIHFDFARSFAQFHPFEWTRGGGYSSGATSWLYPMLLAIGIGLGFHDQSLGSVADVLACVSVFAFFWAARRLFDDLPRWACYLLPWFILTSGVLGWSLWSGMELGLFFGVWGLLCAFYVAHRESQHEVDDLASRRGMAIAGLLLVMTRPEALLCVGCFALYSTGRLSKARLRCFGYVLAPALGFTALRALVNLALTGSLADAGALVKLYTLRPFLDSREVALKWLDNVGFQFSRITVYHTADDALWGWQLWLLVLLAFIPKRTRSHVTLLVLQSFGWILLVAQNEYVRYQNDRYTMPAVLWLLLAVALGVGGALAQTKDASCRAHSGWRTALAATAALLSGSFLLHQFPRLNQQHWLFGRASRNIAEQQIRVGQLFRAGQFGPVQRVLMGDAGAIPYFSELPGVDAIGLGGTHGLPFARAVNLGVGATVELIERMAPEERPDHFALYPTWWDLLPVWFGRPLEEIRIKGNVICGAANKVVYEADWHGLDEYPRPSTLAPHSVIVDELDFADLVSETDHDFEVTSKHSGYVVMKVLPHPSDPNRELFDAGRLVFSDAKTRFFLHGFQRGQHASLVFRAAPNYRMAFRVSIDGRDAGRVEFEGGSGWQEAVLTLEPKHLRPSIAVELTAETSEHILYHLWATSP